MEEQKEIMENDYKCYFCGYEFKQKVRRSSTAEHRVKVVSDQVQCKFCKNFIKTWS